MRSPFIVFFGVPSGEIGPKESDKLPSGENGGFPELAGEPGSDDDVLLRSDASGGRADGGEVTCCRGRCINIGPSGALVAVCCGFLVAAGESWGVDGPEEL